MKKTNRNRAKLVSIIILSLLAILGFGELNSVKAHAAESRTVILHKKKFAATQTAIQNTGQKMPALDSVEGLNGIEFKAYDVSTEFYNQITAGKTVEEAQGLVATTDITGKTAVTSGTTATVSGEDGYLSLSLESIVGSKQAVYLIVETAKAGVDKAANLVVAFPVYEITGTVGGKLQYGDTELQTIHLYPKNVVLRGSLEVEKKSTILGQSVDGAKFVVHRKGAYGVANTEYYKELKANGIVDWTTVASQAKEFTITSSKFLASGLEFGSYFFTETLAPTNHGIITAKAINQPFTINGTTLNVSLTGNQAVLNDGITIAKKTKANENGTYDYNIGESITYTITIPIPLGVADKLMDTTNRYKKFEFTDAHDPELTFENTGYELKADSTVLAASTYTLTPSTNGFKVALNNGFQALLDGKNTLTFTYKMYINEGAKIEKKYKNTAVVTTDWQTATATAEQVATYGKRFIKVDADQNNLALAGAKFVVRSADSNTATYLKQTMNNGKVQKSEWTAVAADRIEFTSAGTGFVDVTGLKAGDYWLEEISAPDGYVKLTSRVKFTVSPTSYYDGEAIQTLKVVNKHKGTLPMTGGLGIYLLIGAGILAMGASGIWYFKRKAI